METYRLSEDLKLFGLRVKTFPLGIGEAFDELEEKLGNAGRSFYGLSWMEGEEIIYYAMAPEEYSGEGQKYNLEEFTIDNGDYLIIRVIDWRSKTDTIKDVFHLLMNDKRTNHLKPCLEWYKNDHEMWCMIQML